LGRARRDGRLGASGRRSRRRIGHQHRIGRPRRDHPRARIEQNADGEAGGGRELLAIAARGGEHPLAFHGPRSVAHLYGRPERRSFAAKGHRNLHIRVLTERLVTEPGPHGIPESALARALRGIGIARDDEPRRARRMGSGWQPEKDDGEGRWE
jgi:hypothetical protein